LAVAASVILAAHSGCVFDESGVPDSVAGLTDALPGGSDTSPDGTDAISPVDAGPPGDAALCLDQDGDQFQVVGVPGSVCGETLDCDDRDQFAYPGQPEFFITERTSGGFDYNCDGTEEPIDTTTGSDCGWDWWDCEGTGWIDGGPPACGQQGTWHVCEDDGGCRETERMMVTMACR
jgi:hypothetical protein